MDKRIIKTKKNLYNGLLELMKDKTFEDIKVNDICTISLVNRSTFYDHFSDKYELFYSLINDLRDELIEDLNKNEKLNSNKEYYMEMIKLFLEHTRDNIDVYSLIIKRNSNSIVMDMIYDTLVTFIEKSIEGSNKEQKIPVEIITKFYVTGVINICLEYIKYPKKYNKEKLLKYFEVLIPDDI